MKKLSCLSALPAFLVAASAHAELFTNGGFETGSGTGAPSGWTLSSGYWNNSGVTVNNLYQSDSAIVSGNGYDVRTNYNLKQVFQGSQAFRLNNSLTGYHWSSLTKTVSNYTDSRLFFSFAVVLEAPGHLISENPRFVLNVWDNTTSTSLAYVDVTAGTGPVAWNLGATGWQYTNWQSAAIDTTSVIGHSLTISFEAYDCALGGHGGYAYIDAISSVTGTGPVIPEPSTYGLALGGLALVGAVIRRRKAAK